MKQWTIVMMLLVAMVTLCASSSMVVADTHYFCQGVSTSWGLNANWRLQENCLGIEAGVPHTDDTAVIVSGKTCDLGSSVQLGNIHLRDGATLNINTSLGVLTLTGIQVASIIDGTINLLSGDIIIAPPPPGERVHDFIGNGQVVGNPGQIQIDPYCTLESGITLRGRMTIERVDDLGTGEFSNEGGVVHADVAGSFKITTWLIRDNAFAEWKVTHPSATLEFDWQCVIPPACGIADLAGDFEVTKGKLLVSKTMQTSGTLTQNQGGVIEVADNEYGKFSH